MGIHANDARQAIARIEQAIGTPEFELTALHAVADATRTSSVLTLRDYRRTAYFGWANQTIGAHELAFLVSRIDGSPFMVSFGRNQGSGDFNRPRETRLRRVAPHLRRAYFLHTRVGIPGKSRFAHLLEHAASTGACFALSREGGLVEANALGDLELHEGSTIELVGGRIRFRVVPVQRAFSLALRSGNPSAAIGLGVPEPSGTALLVDVSGLDLPAASRPAHWLLFVPAGRASRQRLRLEAFALEHGLSELECRVLGQLVLGRDVGEIARELGHQPSTTRTVLKSLFRKTGVHRQTELVLRVLA